jgi:pimeloyl-ACP methyl ester carboxylesterase
MPTADVNGQTLYYEDSGGDGPPLIFLHGFMFDQRMFDPQVEALSDDYRCIRVDTRGFGQTEWDGEAFTLYDVVDDCIGLMDHLGLGEATYIGMSQGAYAALRVAILHPDRVTALVLMSTRKDIMTQEFNENYAAIRDNWSDNKAEIIGNLKFLFLGDPEQFGTYWEEWDGNFQDFSQNQMKHTLNALLDREGVTDEQIEGVEVPVLSIHGLDDVGTPVQLANALYELFPEGKGKVRVEGAAHAVNLTHPQEVNPPLREFLDEYVG